MNLAEPGRIKQYLLFTIRQTASKIDINAKFSDPGLSFGYPVFNMNRSIAEIYLFVVCDRSHCQNDSAPKSTDNQFNRAHVRRMGGIPS